MMDSRTQMLAATVHKLYKRGALRNIQRILAKTFPADIGAILSSFPRFERVEIFKLIGEKEVRAEVLSHLEPNVQKEILLALDPHEIGATVSLMETDDAADLLGHLPEQVSTEILSKMDKEDSADVADLMGYPDDTAGGLMTAEFLALKENLSVGDAIKEIQSKDEEGLVTFYLYVVNETGHLVGVLSLKQLLLSRTAEILRDIMSRDVLSVKIETPQEEVARVVERYDFLSVPVVNESNELLGVITVDDVIDVIREENEEELLAMGGVSATDDHELLDQIRARWPWLTLTFVSGLICFFLIRSFSGLLGQDLFESPAWLLASFIPLIFSVGTTAGHQAATVAVGFVKENALTGTDLLKYLAKELRLGLIFATVFGLISAVLTTVLLTNGRLGIVILLSIVIQMLISVTIGTVIPIWVRRLSNDLTLVSVYLITVIVDISAILVLFGVALTLGSSLFG